MEKDLHIAAVLQHVPDGLRPTHDPPDQRRVEQFIRLQAFIKLMGWSRSTYYNRLRDQALPPPRSNGPRTLGYFESDVVEIQRALTAATPARRVKRK
jgi:predicted DNA-binding transcriptional regulator AlpA